MENATKALLIAGSILIAILLIAMGMKIFGSSKGTVESSQKTMDAATATQFNSQFTPYFGTNVSRARVQALLQKIVASNAVNTEHKIVIAGTSVNSTPRTINPYNYTIIDNTKESFSSVHLDNTTPYKDGYIWRIYIES